MGEPVYGHFTDILHKEKWYIKTFNYIFNNIVENMGVGRVLPQKKSNGVHAIFCSLVLFK